MIEVTAAILAHAGRVLIARRRAGARRGGLWEFPGGKIQVGETPEQCLQREIQEELGVDIAVGEFFGELNDHAEVAWVDTGELDRFDFCPADIALVEMLKKGCLCQGMEGNEVGPWAGLPRSSTRTPGSV